MARQGGSTSKTSKTRRRRQARDRTQRSVREAAFDQRRKQKKVSR